MSTFGKKKKGKKNDTLTKAFPKRQRKFFSVTKSLALITKVHLVSGQSILNHTLMEYYTQERNPKKY